MTRDPVDHLLDQWQVGQPSSDLANRIVARSREVEQQGRQQEPVSQAWGQSLHWLLPSPIPPEALLHGWLGEIGPQTRRSAGVTR